MTYFVVAYEGVPQKVFDRKFHAEQHVSSEIANYEKAQRLYEQFTKTPPANPAEGLLFTNAQDVLFRHDIRPPAITEPKFTAEQEARLTELSEKSQNTVLEPAEDTEFRELQAAKITDAIPSAVIDENIPTHIQVFTDPTLDGLGEYTVTEIQ